MWVQINILRSSCSSPSDLLDALIILSVFLPVLQMLLKPPVNFPHTSILLVCEPAPVMQNQLHVVCVAPLGLQAMLLC